MLNDGGPPIGQGAPAALATSAPEPGQYSISKADAFGVICGEGSGVWAPAQIDAFFCEFEVVTVDGRARFGAIRVLLDLRLALVSGREGFDRMVAGTQRIYRPEDRLAMVVQSTLVKMQMRRLQFRAQTAYFTSVYAARAWLDAES